MRFVKRLSYLQDIQLFTFKSTMIWYLLLIALFLIAPLVSGLYWVSLMILIGVYIIVALGLNLLTGYTGQVSLGHAAFFAVGAYTSAVLTGTFGISFWLALPISGIVTGIVGIVIGLPALRLRGLYLAIATMGFGFIIEEVIIQWESLTNGVNGLQVIRPKLGTIDFTSDVCYYYLVFGVCFIMILILKNILRTPTGRAFIAIRDSEVAAESMGINLAMYKTAAFCISAFYTGIAGSLFAHFMFFIGPENFNLLVSISFLVMILVGGVASVHGAVFGAIFITLLPELISLTKDYLPDVIAGKAGLQAALFGLILILFIRFEPLGLYGRWMKIKFYFEHFPFYKKDTFRRVRKFYRTERM
jgi:branched-chain amino acid transport system permease protein